MENNLKPIKQKEIKKPNEDIVLLKENSDKLFAQSQLLKEQSSAPTYNPKNFFEQFCLYNGSLYVNVDNNWVSSLPQYFTSSGTTNGTTGTQAFTGIGFTPRMVRIIANYGAGATKGFSDGRATSSSNNRCMTQWFDSSKLIGQNINNNNLINLIDSSGSSVFVANLYSFDTDGFTINITNATGGACSIIYECFA